MIQEVLSIANIDLRSAFAAQTQSNPNPASINWGQPRTSGSNRGYPVSLPKSCAAELALISMALVSIIEWRHDKNMYKPAQASAVAKGNISCRQLERTDRQRASRYSA
jgi:hypothetical protein